MDALINSLINSEADYEMSRNVKTHIYTYVTF